MPRTQTLVQLTDGLLARLDERAAREGQSRSALIRKAIEAYLRDEHSAEVDRRIVDGYRRHPQSREELDSAFAAARDAIRDEPW